jgi:chromosome segregation ATPase
MNASPAGSVVVAAREQLHKTELQARDCERRLHVAQDMNRQAKLKFKQARKWARQTKKLVKKAKSDAADKQQALAAASERLKKLEKKAMKESRKTHAKRAPAKSLKKAPAKPIEFLAERKHSPLKKRARAKAAPALEAVPTPDTVSQVPDDLSPAAAAITAGFPPVP